MCVPSIGHPYVREVTAEEFANKLENGRQVSKPSNDKKGEVMINLDVIETILMDSWPSVGNFLKLRM